MLKQFTTEDKRIHIFGRTKRGKETPLFWTGSGFEILTDSSEVWIDFELNYDLHEYWVRVDLDGKTLQRVLLDKDQKTLCAFRPRKNAQADSSFSGYCLQLLPFA